MNQHKADFFINHLSVPGYENLFFINCGLERRVTVLSQQVRALSLFSALTEDRIFKERRAQEKRIEICVIGAGIAGCTFAGKAAHYGCIVDIWEKEEKVLTQLDNASRYLHPRLYDWPKPHWNEGKANVPILNWEAGEGKIVNQQIRKQWDIFCELYNDDPAKPDKTKPSINVHTSCPNLEIKTTGKIAHIHYSEPEYPNDHIEKKYDYIVLCVGFGKDATINYGIPSAVYSVIERQKQETCYWNDRPMQISRNTNPRNFLFSGTGDSGLTDVFEFLVEDFKQEHLAEKIRKLSEAPVFSGFGERLLTLEDEYRDACDDMAKQLKDAKQEIISDLLGNSFNKIPSHSELQISLSGKVNNLFSLSGQALKKIQEAENQIIALFENTFKEENNKMPFPLLRTSFRLLKDFGPNDKLTLHGRGPTAYSIKSFPLNRLIWGILSLDRRIQYNSLNDSPLSRRGNKNMPVSLDELNHWFPDISFDGIALRYGAEPALEKAFHEIHEQIKKTRTAGIDTGANYYRAHRPFAAKDIVWKQVRLMSEIFDSVVQASLLEENQDFKEKYNDYIEELVELEIGKIVVTDSSVFDGKFLREYLIEASPEIWQYFEIRCRKKDPFETMWSILFKDSFLTPETLAMSSLDKDKNDEIQNFAEVFKGLKIKPTSASGFDSTAPVKERIEWFIKQLEDVAPASPIGSVINSWFKLAQKMIDHPNSIKEWRPRYDFNFGQMFGCTFDDPAGLVVSIIEDSKSLNDAHTPEINDVIECIKELKEKRIRSEAYKNKKLKEWKQDDNREVADRIKAWYDHGYNRLLALQHQANMIETIQPYSTLPTTHQRIEAGLLPKQKSELLSLSSNGNLNEQPEDIPRKTLSAGAFLENHSNKVLCEVDAFRIYDIFIPKAVMLFSDENRQSYVMRREIMDIEES